MALPMGSRLDAEDVRLAAREHVLSLLALAASDPSSRRFGRVLDRERQELACAAARHLAADPASRPARLAPGEEPPDGLDLEPLVEALAAPLSRLVADHDRVFGLVLPKECPPYEVEYCPQTFSVHRSQQLADVAGFYRAFGLGLGRDAPERADHVACELEFQAWLVAKERRARAERRGEEWAEHACVCRDAQRRFVGEHLAWWTPAFARALSGRAAALDPPAPLQAALGRALAALVPAERALLGVEPPRILARPSPAGLLDEEGCAGCVLAGGPASLPGGA